MPFVDLGKPQQVSNSNPSQPVVPAQGPPAPVSVTNVEPHVEEPAIQPIPTEPENASSIAAPVNDVPVMDTVIQDEIKPVIKDPVSEENGLIHDAYQNMPAPVNSKFEQMDGVKIISRPFETQEVKQPEQAQTAPVPQPVPEVKGFTPAPIDKTVKQEPKQEKLSSLSAIRSQKAMAERIEAEPAPIDVTAPLTEKPLSEDDLEKNVLNPNTSDIEEYLELGIKSNISDVHLSVGYPVYFRIDGRLERVGVEPLTSESLERLVSPIMNDEQIAKVKEIIEVDFMHVGPDNNRFRVNVYKEKGQMAAALRLIPKRVRTIEQLMLPTILREFSKIPYGLVLVTGPTGSGKSTTIAAMVEEINRLEPRHIITIEDPVEYVYEKKLALIAQRNMHEDTNKWGDALRAVLRQDPDVVVIGEMRDYETIASALTIAETGHLVFATLHTNTAAQSIDRMIDVFPEGQQNQIRIQLSNMLSGVISQRLIPLKNGGRRAATEILIGTTAVKNAIREAKTHQIDNIIQTSLDVGMVSLEKSLVEMIRQGLIDIDTAKNFTMKPEEIDILLR